MPTQYSGRTSAHAHKFDDWATKVINEPVDCIQMVQVFYVQWTNCPIEVYEEVQKLWKNDCDLRNGSYFAWARDNEFWDETMEDESDKSMAEAYPLIDEYLMARGIEAIQINYWW